MDFFDVVHSQRAIRRFRPEPIPQQALWKMLDAAIRAPSGSNSQPWIWLVVQDKTKREALAAKVRETMGGAGRIQALREGARTTRDATQRRTSSRAADLMENVAMAPVIIIPCLYQVTSPSTDARSLFAGSSIYQAVQNLLLAARAQGIGSCFTTFNIRMEDWLRQEFKLPAEAIPTCMIPVGFPDRQNFGPTNRKPIESVTYWDEWGKLRQRS